MEDYLAAGVPEEESPAHIAYFIVWAADHDQLAPEEADAGLVQEVRLREPGAFVSALEWSGAVVWTGWLRPEARPFASACYASYVDRYEAAFGERTYHPSNWSDYTAAAAILDALRSEVNEPGGSFTD